MASQHYFSSFTGYGKTGVRLLKIKRISEKYHSIREVEVSVELKLDDKKDYLKGDNASVIPTDTQKNTIYALATKNEVRLYINTGKYCMIWA
jgi:urate oxidase